jgi:dihydroneopterin aldolase/2-amino-4-hydroxy-6-hydroxymethyldihydropteridine diphosphokinase/dihydropteroate synthase/2-amino-4-hydroxy-6-hydroxymethyldihydropteridine diphosphokinase/dihydropteroate synthase
MTKKHSLFLINLLNQEQKLLFLLILMDKIIIKDLIVKGNLGSNQWQYSKEQMLHFNVVGFIDFDASDNISSTISYSTIASHIQNATEKESKIKTLEALADKIALGCLKFGLEKVVLKIEKSHALLHADTVGIEITREKKHIEYLNALVLDLPFDELVLDAEDSIFIKDLMINCIIGVNPCERIEKQRVIVNITMKYNWEPTQSRSIVKNNYAVVAKKASSFIENSNYKTIEMMAEDLSSVILNQCNVEKVLVRIEKPSALMFAKTAGVEIVRRKSHSKPHSFNNEPKNSIVYIAVGTNIGNRVQNIQQAIEKLETAGIFVIDTSFLYETKPMYVLDQPKFLNAALKVSILIQQGTNYFEPFEVIRKLESD